MTKVYCSQCLASKGGCGCHLDADSCLRVVLPITVAHWTLHPHAHPHVLISCLRSIGIISINVHTPSWVSMVMLVCIVGSFCLNTNSEFHRDHSLSSVITLLAMRNLRKCNFYQLMIWFQLWFFPFCVECIAVDKF